MEENYELEISSTHSMVGFVIWWVVAVVGLLLHITALYLILTKKNRKIMDILLINLSCVELTYIVAYLARYTVHLILISHKGAKLNVQDHSYTNNTSSGPYNTSNPSPININTHGWSLLDDRSLAWIFIMGTSIPFYAYLSILLITLDRVLSVYLTFKYTTVVTKTKTCVALAVTLMTSIILGTNSLLNERQWIAWVIFDIVMAILLISSYTYIICKLGIPRRSLGKNSICRRKTPTFKYRIPLLIMTSFILLVLLPDLALAIRPSAYSIWFPTGWCLNFSLDAMIYVFYSGRMRRRKNAVRPTLPCDTFTNRDDNLQMERLAAMVNSPRVGRNIREFTVPYSPRVGRNIRAFMQP